MIYLTPDIVYIEDEDFEELPRTAGALDEDTAAMLALVIDADTYLDWDGFVKAAYSRNDEAALQFAVSL